MISVIIPAYNAEVYISETIESIFNQTFKDFEIIVIDDGSTDSTVSIVKKYMSQDPRIRLVQQSNRGTSHARNNGIAHAKYNWIAPIDADDVLLPQRFEKQLATATQCPQVVDWESENTGSFSKTSLFRLHLTHTISRYGFGHAQSKANPLVNDYNPYFH